METNEFGFDVAETLNNRRKWREGYQAGIDDMLVLIGKLAADISNRGDRDFAVKMLGEIYAYYEKVPDTYREAKKIITSMKVNKIRK